MGQLKIHKVHYEGKAYTFSSPPLDEHKVNIIEAPNGSGKSTLFDLIYYSLGGRVSHFNKSEKVTHKEIVSDTSNFVELEISANGNYYRLVRKIGENLITIFSKSDLIVNGENTGNFACLAINRHRIDDYIFSDWLLNELNIPA
ncbi:TPA: AAA family ATPase, partial [Escherichia coli]|nr:AAA family ATPase [Escherichia coli]